MNQPTLSLDMLTPEQQEEVRRKQAEWFSHYQAWLQHPFTKLRWQHAYREMRQTAAMLLMPGQRANLELETLHLAMKGIVDGTFDYNVYAAVISDALTGYLADNKPAQAEAEALASQSGGGGSRDNDAGSFWGNLFRAQSR